MTDIKRLTESLHKKYKINESKWNYTLNSSKGLRKAIDEGDAVLTAKMIYVAYGELKSAGLIDEDDCEEYQEHVLELAYSDPDDWDDYEEEVDYELSELYDLCDNLGVWISLDESYNKTTKASSKLTESASFEDDIYHWLSNHYGTSDGGIDWKDRFKAYIDRIKSSGYNTTRLPDDINKAVKKFSKEVKVKPQVFTSALKESLNESSDESGLNIGKIRLRNKSGTPLSLSFITDDPMRFRDIVEDARNVKELINNLNRAGLYAHNFKLDRETSEYIRLTCDGSFGSKDYLILTKKNSPALPDNIPLKIKKISLVTKSGIPEALSNLGDNTMEVRDIIEDAKSAQEIINKLNRSSNVRRRFRLDRETNDYIRLEGKDVFGGISYLILTKEKP